MFNVALILMNNMAVACRVDSTSVRWTCRVDSTSVRWTCRVDSTSVWWACRVDSTSVRWTCRVDSTSVWWTCRVDSTSVRWTCRSFPIMSLLPPPSSDNLTFLQPLELKIVAWKPWRDTFLQHKLGTQEYLRNN